MNKLTYGQQPTVIQKAILLDISEIAWAIEEEFSDVFKPYKAGWYHQLDEGEPSMPDIINLKNQVYHCKGGGTERWVGVVEKVTIITDPNLAQGSIYNDDGEIVVSLRSMEISKKHPYTERNIFTRRPRYPVLGSKVVTAYVNWIIDHSCEWQPIDTPPDEYLKPLFDKMQIDAAEVLEVEDTTVRRYNALLERVWDRLQMYSMELRHALDTFVGRSTWDTYSIRSRGFHSLHIEKNGDYRILEWERLKKEGKV